VALNQEDVWGNGGKRVQPRTNLITHKGNQYNGTDAVTQNQQHGHTTKREHKTTGLHTVNSSR